MSGRCYRSSCWAIARLEAARRATWRRWARLFRDPDCLSDPAKRRAMLFARCQYQDATDALYRVLRRIERIESARAEQ